MTPAVRLLARFFVAGVVLVGCGDDQTDRAANEQPQRSMPNGSGGLRIAPELPRDGYSRDQFGDGWSDADGDGCDARCEVLKLQRLAAVPGLGGPGWFSVYDGEITSDPSEFDVDHVVALAEAWDSGASGWSAERREQFANEIGPELIAVSAASNRSKGDDDPAEWQPSRQEAWCDFISDWVSVKKKWDLAADPAEMRAIKNISAGCPRA
jgi:hypothetical protein